MANREALRELQSRLAQRLAAARTETPKQSWLAVECADVGLLLPLASAGEIFPLSVLTPVPHTEGWFLGVANLRGNLHGVVDLAAFLGLRAPLALDALREQSRIVAFNPAHGAHCAVLVDRLAGLRSTDQLSAEAEAPQDLRPGFAGTLWRDAAGRTWQEIDLSALARNRRFLAIAA
ncbi:MAG: CheW domain-containing protein [Pseudomonadota bacterium]|nr:CheW domain-containing protein [Pseudomonadota bacterium]